jgi:hypothetical protein
MDKIRESFAAYFEGFGLQLPDPVPAQGYIWEKEWSITYVVIPDEHGQPCLEFVANNRFTNSRHIRILSTGETIPLDTIEDSFTYNPDVPGDREAAEARMLAHNEAVMADLTEKGLM